MDLIFDPAIPLLQLYPKNPEKSIKKNICTPMSIATQYIRSPSIGSSLNSHQLMSGYKTIIHLRNGIVCSKKNEGAPTLFDSMDGTGEHYAK